MCMYNSSSVNKLHFHTNQTIILYSRYNNFVKDLEFTNSELAELISSRY